MCVLNWVEEEERRDLRRRMGEEGVKLVGSWYSPYVARAVWALKLKGVQYEYVEEDLRNKSALLLSSNPVIKKVPVLIHNGKPIVESLTIVEYVDETWKEEEPILPRDPYERAMARFWAKFAEEKFLNSVRTAFFTDGDEQAKAIEGAAEALEILEQELKGKKFFGGEKIGLVDITMGLAAHWLAALEGAGCIKLVDLPNFPSISGWTSNFLAHPIVNDNLPALDRLIPHFKSLRQIVIASK